MSLPPPLAASAANAFSNAAVLSVTPSPTPPQSARLTLFLGITGNGGGGRVICAAALKTIPSATTKNKTTRRMKAQEFNRQDGEDS